MPHLPEEQAILAVLEALDADPELSSNYVLKGGNALRFAFDGRRASVDLDFSSRTTYTLQSEEETQAVLAEFTDRLNQTLKGVAPQHEFAQMVVQSTDILPPNRPHREFPALQISVGYSRRTDRDPPFNQAVKLEVTLNETVCEDEYVPVSEGATLHVCSLNDIIAEKLRSLLQQPIRNRQRPADVYDIWFYIDRRSRLLDFDRIGRFLQEKCEGRERITLSKEAFWDPEIQSRANTDWEQIADRLPGDEELPTFERAFAAVRHVVEQLDIPEQFPS